MNKTTVKADKLVTKATTVFGDAVIQVNKANELLSKGIDEDARQIALAEEKIVSLQEEISTFKNSRDSKTVKIESNNTLIEQLQNFVPQK